MLLLARSALFITVKGTLNLAITHCFFNSKGVSMADDKDLDTNSTTHEEGQWKVFPDSKKYELKGFLQMCIERRFHAAVQACFQEVTGLEETTYWIHTDVGGTPGMEDNDGAPNYCYEDPQNARIMGWSAHGSGCGGFPGMLDPAILDLLMETVERQAAEYPEARHFAFFARNGQRPGEIEVMYTKGKKAK